MRAVEQLKAEHDRILAVLELLEKIADRIVFGEAVSVEHLKGIIEFFQILAHRCHHGKEEAIFFPELEGAELHMKGGSIDALLSEHERGRMLIAEIKTLLESHEVGNRGSLLVLTNPVLQYINLMRSHIWKENDLLYPLVEKITEQRHRDLEERFLEFEKKAACPESRRSFAAFVDELESCL